MPVRPLAIAVRAVTPAAVSGDTALVHWDFLAQAPLHEEVVCRRQFGVRIAEMVRQTGLPHESVLRDHALSYMLAGIAAIPELAAARVRID